MNTKLTKENYNTVLRGMGMVDSGLSGSRGSYGISSYKWCAKKRAQGFSGYVEVHTDWATGYFSVMQQLQCKKGVITVDVQAS